MKTITTYPIHASRHSAGRAAGRLPGAGVPSYPCRSSIGFGHSRSGRVETSAQATKMWAIDTQVCPELCAQGNFDENLYQEDSR